MEAQTLLSSAINRINEWRVEDPEDPMLNPMINILEYAMVNLHDRKQPYVRNAIALAYGILGSE